MKKLLLILSFSLCTTLIFPQFVAIMQVDEPIEGLCNQEEVYALFPMIGGQKEAVCPISEKEIEQKLNEELSFLQENPKFKGKGMVNIIINCEGILVQCEMGGTNSSGSEILDAQIIEIFENLGDWKPGRLSSKKVDSVRLYTIKVKKGVLTLD